MLGGEARWEMKSMDPPPKQHSFNNSTLIMTQVIHPTARAFLMPAHQFEVHIFIRADWQAGRKALYARDTHGILCFTYKFLFKSQISPARVGVTILDLGSILKAFPDQFYALGGLKSIVLHKLVPNNNLSYYSFIIKL